MLYIKKEAPIIAKNTRKEFFMNNKNKKHTYTNKVNRENTKKNKNNILDPFDFTDFFNFLKRAIIVPSPWYIWYLVNIFSGYNYLIPKLLGACTLSILSFEACADEHWPVWVIYLSAFILAIVMMLMYRYLEIYKLNIL